MTFKVDPIIDVDTFTNEIQEDISDLTLAMRTQTARAAYYGTLLAAARKQSSRVGLQIKATEAALTKKHRLELTDEAVEIANTTGGKPERITADMVKAAVMTDRRMLELLRVQIDVDEIRSVCQIAYDAFRTRRDMLVSLGHMSTAEMKALGNQTVSATDNIKRYHDRRRARENGGAET